MSRGRSVPHGDLSDVSRPGDIQGVAVEPSVVAPSSDRATVHHPDNRGSSCALGLVRVKQRLSEIPLGDVLEMVTRDRFAPFEVPAWIEREGLELELMWRSGWWLLISTTFRIRKTIEVAGPRVRA